MPKSLLIAVAWQALACGPLLLGQGVPPQFSADERCLFADETASNWSLRIDAPGKPSELLKIGTGTIPRATRIDYRFTHGGNYIGIKRETNLSSADAIAFSVRSEAPMEGVVILEGSDGQVHRGTFQTSAAGDTRVRLPLTKEGFPKFWDGGGDGKFHFPVRRLTVAAAPNGQKSGEFEVFDFAFVPSDGSAAASCAIQLEPSEFDNVFFPGEEKVIPAHVRNPTGRPLEATLTVSGLSDSVEKFHFSQTVSLAAYEAEVLPLSLPLPTPSFVELTVSVNAEGLKEAVARTGIAVVPPPALDQVPFREAFFGTSFGENPKTMKRIGARFIREIIHWKYTNPSDGVFSFEKYVDWGRRCREAGLGTIYTFAIWQRPDWLVSRDPGILKNEDSFQRWKSWLQSGLQTLLVDPRCEAVEVGNEPDLEFAESLLVKKDERIDLIAKLIRTGYDLTRSISPDIPVLGAGCSGGGDGSLRMVEAILPRLDHKIDYLSIHPYPAGAQLMKPDGAWTWPDGFLERTVSAYEPVVSAFTGGKKIWCTELGWAYPVTGSRVDAAALDYAAVCSQTLVILKSVEHVGKVSWFIGTGLEPTRYGGATHAEAGFSYNFFRRAEFGKYEPTTAVSAFATASSLLEGARPQGKLDLGPAMVCYLFDNPATGNCVAVLWAAKRPVLADLGKKHPITSMQDTYGRLVLDATVRLTRSPVFLMAERQHLNDLKTLLHASSYSPEEPVEIDQIRAGAANEVLVDLVSYEGGPQDISLSAGNVTHSGTLRAGKNTVGITLPPGLFASDRLLLPLELSVKNGPSKKTLFSKSLIHARYCPSADLHIDSKSSGHNGIVLDRELDKRTDILPADPNVGWSGQEDLSVRYGFAWNEGGLYFVTEVRDDEHVPTAPEAADFYQYDSLQFVIDPKCDSGESLKAGDREGGVALDSNGATQTYQLFPITTGKPKFDAWAYRAGKMTVYKIAVPASALGEKALTAGEFVALNFIINDNDGSGRHYWMGPSDGIANGKRPTLYPWVYLEPKK